MNITILKNTYCPKKLSAFIIPIIVVGLIIVASGKYFKTSCSPCHFVLSLLLIASGLAPQAEKWINLDNLIITF
jgi:hypothetical protein